MTPKKNEPRRWGDGRAAALAHADAIRTWLAAGRTLKTYYDEHAGELAISYSQFAKLTRVYLKANRPAPAPALASTKQSGASHDSSRPNPIQKPEPPTQGPASGPTSPPAAKPGGFRTFSHKGDASDTDTSDLY